MIKLQKRDVVYFVESGDPHPSFSASEVFNPMADFVPPGVYLGIEPKSGEIMAYRCDEGQILTSDSSGNRLTMEDVPVYLVAIRETSSRG